MYILITAANSAEAYNQKRSLNSDKILLGDYLEVPEVLVRSGKLLQLPDPGNPSYQHLFLAMCLDKQVDTVYALRNAEKEMLAAAKTLFDEYGINLIL